MTAFSHLVFFMLAGLVVPDGSRPLGLQIELVGPDGTRPPVTLTELVIPDDFKPLGV